MSTEPSPDLLACPFCGGEAEININMPYTPHLFYIRCPKCIIHVGHSDTEKSAIEAWNTRPAPQMAAGKEIEWPEKKYCSAHEDNGGAFYCRDSCDSCYANYSANKMHDAFMAVLKKKGVV